MPLAKPAVHLNCIQCGAAFSVQPYRATTAKYCSWQCGQKGKAAISNKIIAAKYRGTGTRGYVKLNGRHMHRVVAEQKLGRPLMPGEIVHHVDGDKHNNAPSNLQVMSQRDHARMHRSNGDMARKTPKIATGCTVAGCLNPYSAKGLCRFHYIIKWKESRRATQTVSS